MRRPSYLQLGRFCSHILYSALVLAPKKERAILNRHPWIFSGAVKTAPKAEDGDIVSVTDAAGKTLGYGFYSTRSQIVVRLFHFGEVLTPFDDTYWVKKITDAYKIRKEIIPGFGVTTNCYRLVHAEGDFFPGVIIDIYNNYAGIQLRTMATEKLYPVIEKALKSLGIDHIYLKNKQQADWKDYHLLETGWLTPATNPLVEVLENGIAISLDIEKGQKTGFFLDQRDNRALLGSYAKGKRVLNTFGYTGGFSLYALQNKAAEVVTVDISKDAIAAANANVEAVFGTDTNHSGVVADCFAYLKATPPEWDCIVLDPPAFAKNRGAVPNATRGYKELNMLAMRAIKPEGGILFTFSCSQHVDRDLFRKVVFGAAADVGRQVRILHQLTQPADHPVSIYHPEGEYLKGLVLYID